MQQLRPVAAAPQSVAVPLPSGDGNCPASGWRTDAGLESGHAPASMRGPACAVGLAAALLAGLAAAPRGSAAPRPQSLLGYIRQMPPESPSEREERHRRVAARRAQDAVLICHRGASSFATENTLEAYAAAMDYGADGCEFDVRRTTDGVLCLFHDDMLDHLTDGFGTVEGITYPQLLSLRPRYLYGTARPDTRPPTLAALLTLARQRAMVLYFDVKRPGLEAELARILSEADMWDQVAGLNTETLPALRKDPRVHLLQFKGPGLYDNRKDVDPAGVRAQLARPGKAVMLDDPRVAARELGRKPQRVPLPSLREPWPAPPPLPLTGYGLHWPGSSASRLDPAALLEGIEADRAAPRLILASSPRREELEAGLIGRAWRIEALGYSGKPSPRAIAALEYELEHRTLHPDWLLHGMDGAMAVRALGMLGATASAPKLAAAFRGADPALKQVQDPRFGPNPLAWTDFRVKMYIPEALGRLRCKESKAFLLEMADADPATLRELAPLQYEEIAKALMAQELSQSEIEALLRHRNGAVRGTAVLECLDHPSRARTAALRAAAPWAASLPSAGRR